MSDFKLCSNKAMAQPNCNAYLYYGDTLKYKACTIAEKKTGILSI